MNEQLSLTGLGEPAKPTDRLFFAIFPSADAAAQIAQLTQRVRGQHGLSGKAIATDRFHSTLNHLGDYAGVPQDIVAMAMKAAVLVEMSPFDVVFDRVWDFGRPRNRPIVLRGGDGLAGLAALQQSLGAAMAKSGLGDWVELRYTPHVTMLYDDKQVAEQAVEPIVWTVHEFVLVHSLLGRTQHIPLARFPLRG
jgi:RNA 2',3'-cyclic 3'-phosphodiesterase